jgi:hypothetical protein
MKAKATFRKKYIDKKIKITGRVYLMLVLFMFIIVVYDSFVHNLPFYYILFIPAGNLIGRFVALTQKVVIEKDKHSLSLRVNPAGIVITVILLLTRFFIGSIILEEFNVVWVTDGIYLLFIGIYYTRGKDMFRQIDEQVYGYIFGTTKKNEKRV